MPEKKLNVQFTPDKTKITQGGYDKTFDTGHILSAISKRAVFHTGLLPPGVRMISQAGERTQVVIERPPGINLVWWGRSEGDVNAKLYELAQPFQIILADFRKETLLGARLFYSPRPLMDPDQQLYHANVPNLNCRGYQGTGVGWQCLYLRGEDKYESLHEAVVSIIERSSGAEAYNDNNMSGTDGPRFYKSMNKPRMTWDPAYWEQKSHDDGVEWTLDDDLWIPIEVAGIDDQQCHVTGGEPLTLAMAVEGGYAPYYREPKDPKLYTTTRQGEYSPELFEQMISQPITSGGRPWSSRSRLLDRAEHTVTPEPCVLCATDTPHTRAGHFICEDCQSTHRCCTDCGRELTEEYFHGPARVCNDCKSMRALK